MRKLLTIHLLCTVIFSQGLFDIIHEDGGKKINYYRKNGKKIELSRQEYYYKSGNMKAEGNYRNGEKEGRWTRYYDNSQIKEQGNYKSGNKVDRWISYYEDGAKKSEGSYKDGRMDGQWIYFYEDGAKKSEGSYKDERMDGQWIYFYEDGSQMQSIKNGKVVKLIDSSSDNIWHAGERFICRDGKDISSDWVDDKECDCEECEDEPFMNK